MLDDLEQLKSISFEDILRLFIYDYFINNRFENNTIYDYLKIFYQKYSNFFNYFSDVDYNVFKYITSQRLNSLFNSDFNFNYISSVYSLLSHYLNIN